MKRPHVITATAIFLSALLLGACSGSEDGVKLTSAQEKALSERLAPEGKISLASEVSNAPASSASASRSGEEVYAKSCKTCHGSGMGGAPKFGTASDWTARLDQGMDSLYISAIGGFQGMPPKGLCMDCSDDELKAAVDYILEGSK